MQMRMQMHSSSSTLAELEHLGSHFAYETSAVAGNGIAFLNKVSVPAGCVSVMMVSTKRRGDGLLHQVRHPVDARPTLLCGLWIRTASVFGNSGVAGFISPS
jgi:hypothetical protein